MPIAKIPASQGYVSRRSPYDLKPGELQAASGCFYKTGDPDRLWRIAGRSAFALAAASQKIKGIVLAQFDSGGSDIVAALAGTTIFQATPGETGSFSALVGSLNSSAISLSGAHVNDRWYLANGYDPIQVVNSAGTVRPIGMDPPGQATAAVSADTGTHHRPNASSNGSPGWTNPDKAYDTDPLTKSHATSSSASTRVCTWTWAAGAIAAGTVLNITYGMNRMDNVRTESSGTGGGDATKVKVTCKIELSETIGGTATYSTILEQNLTGDLAKTTLQYPLAVADNYSKVAVRASFVYTSGTVSATMKIFDIDGLDGSTVTAFDTTTGFYYAVTEYDGTNDLESVWTLVTPSDNTDNNPRVVLDDDNVVTITLPSAAANTTSTHWKIYRTPDGGEEPYQLGLVATIPIAQTSWKDLFTEWGQNDQPIPIIRHIYIQSGVGKLAEPVDLKPPALLHLNAFKGSLVGTSRDYPRALYYSEAGYPESWPGSYILTKFPVPEHDELVQTVTIGDTLLLLMKDVVLRTTDLPRYVNGTFIAVDIAPMHGQPGCVAVGAACAYAVEGEPRAAWVSPHGVHETNGVTARVISEDIAWETDLATASLTSSKLFYDKKRRLLIFAYDSDGGGTNDRYFLFHMGPEQSKWNGLPKLTGPHHGAINCLTAGMVANIYRMYSGHVSNGYVYLENNGTTDASLAYNASGDILFKMTTPYVNGGDGRQLGVYRCRVHHDAMNGALTFTHVTRRDHSGTTQTVTKTVTAGNNQRVVDVLVARGGDWHYTDIQTTISTTGGIRILEYDVLALGLAGRQA